MSGIVVDAEAVASVCSRVRTTAGYLGQDVANFSIMAEGRLERMDGQGPEAAALRLEEAAGILREGSVQTASDLEACASEIFGADSQHAQYLDDLTGQMEEVALAIEGLYNNFDPAAGITCVPSLLAIRDQFPAGLLDQAIDPRIKVLLTEFKAGDPYNWDVLVGLDWVTVQLVIAQLLDADGLRWALDEFEVQRTAMENWYPGITEGFEVELLLEMLQFRLIFDQIVPIIEHEDFGLDAWNTADLAERQRLLNEFMAQIAPFFGLEVWDGTGTLPLDPTHRIINPDIDFFAQTRPDHTLHNPVGQYRHAERLVRINLWWLDPERRPIPHLRHGELVCEVVTNPGSHTAFRTVMHEVVHAFQAATTGYWRNPTDQPWPFFISTPSRRTWESNDPAFGGVYIGSRQRPTDSLQIDPDREDIPNARQPIEANARLFDHLWNDVVQGSPRTYRPLPGWRPVDEFRCVPPAPPAQSLQAK
ncbi:MAG: hypothetical protein FWG11_09675 [Promicromonosporaceae bacterium]|nr:hypothetical protein [Promicromonosporaceae bacterium]